VLAITGSNGKTTVTALTGALCRAAGLATIVAGNIGNAVLDVLDPIVAGIGRRDWPDVFVLELSSFQLETTASLRPTAAAVLTSPTITSTATAASTTMRRRSAGSSPAGACRCSTATIRARSQWRSGPGGGDLRRRRAGLGERVGAGRAGADGRDPWLARGGALLAPLADLALLGRHNGLNALVALALTSSVAKISRPVLAALTRFEGLPHRMQRIGEAAGVLYVNDSKGTTIAATQVALEGLGRPVVLIAGGDGKGQDFAPLLPLVDAHCRAVLLIAATARGSRARLRHRGAGRDAGHARRGGGAGGEARAAGRRRRAVPGLRQPGPVLELRRAWRALRDARARAHEHGERACVRTSPRPRRCARSAC